MMKHFPVAPPVHSATPPRATPRASSRGGSRAGLALLGILGAVLPGACSDEPSAETVVQPSQPAILPSPSEGALIDVSAASQVGVVLDEIPEGLRAPLADFYLSQP